MIWICKYLIDFIREFFQKVYLCLKTIVTIRLIKVQFVKQEFLYHFLGKLFATILLMMNPPSDSHFDMVSIITLLTSALKFFVCNDFKIINIYAFNYTILWILQQFSSFSTLFEPYFCQIRKSVRVNYLLSNPVFLQKLFSSDSCRFNLLE